MEPITIGSKGTASVKVDETNLALTVGSGSLPVFATPMMAALMEEAACNAIAPFLSEGETTVGTKLDISNDAATPEGLTVTATAEITGVSGRDLIPRDRRGRRGRDRLRHAQALSGGRRPFLEQGTETGTVSTIIKQ